MASSGSFLRQISGKEAWKSTSNRWSGKNKYEASLNQMEGFRMCGNEENSGNVMVRKRVMVVVDHTWHSKHAMMWALTHVADKGDLVTLLHVVPPDGAPPSQSSSSTYLLHYLVSLCRDCKPEVCSFESQTNVLLFFRC